MVNRGLAWWLARISGEYEMATIHSVPAGQTITVTAAAGSVVQVSALEDSTVGALIRNGSQVFGPYLRDRTFQVEGMATVALADASVATMFGGLLMTTAGAPADAVAATADVNPAGAENGLTFTAVKYGTDGNVIGVKYVDPGANDAALSVSVAGNEITISLATGEAGAITSTAAEVLAAINADPVAGRMVVASIYAADSGESDDGSGVVTAMARSGLSTGAGTGVGVALPGCICIDRTNGALYRNSGTTAAPAWTQLADAS